MFTVALHAEPQLSDMVKLRGDLTSTPIFTAELVNNSNFGNKNIFCDNTVELGAATQSLPPIVATIPGENNACAANVIRISWESYVVIGFITDWEYTNDNNMRVSYRVDAFMSALLSNMITDIDGICERISMTTGDEYFANEQSEPFTPSDNSWADPITTSEFNDGIHTFEGITVGSRGVLTSGTCFILTVSPKVAEWCGTDAFGTPPTPVPELKTIGHFKFSGADTTQCGGGLFRGIPFKFASWSDVQAFIKGILSGCGFRTIFPATGYSTQESVTRRLLMNVPNDAGGTSTYWHKNWNNDPYESISFIGGSDLYNLYCVPEKLLDAAAGNGFVEGYCRAASFTNLDDMHNFGSETDRAGKLLMFPYVYTKMVTANGDTATIIPQIHYEKDSAFKPSFSVQMSLRFVGGDTPRLLGRLVPGFASSGLNPDPYADDSVCEWFTIRNYPAVTLSFNDSYNPQIQRDITSSRKLMVNYMNTVALARLTSPVSQGYRDYVNQNGERGIRNDNQGLLGSLGYIGGATVGGLQGVISDALGVRRGSLLSDIDRQRAQNESRADRYGNIITAEQGVVMGNDFLSQYGIPAVACYVCGATDAEMYTFCRYLEEYGTAYNGRVKPLQKDYYAMLGGLAEVDPFDGRVFYRFSHVKVEGAMPQEWRNNIKALFESGAYLLEG